METEFNLFLLATWVVVAACLTVSDPVSAMEPGVARDELAQLEDAVARRPDDADAARRLAERYLDLHRPAFAIAALSAVDPEVQKSPLVAHRLAQAYEASGRLPDALATAQLALARCARSLGSADAWTGTVPPRQRCLAREHAVLGMHVAALTQMTIWGVQDPRTDPRARLAHHAAERRARIATR